MLPDIVAPGLRLLVCGVAAGECSVRRGHYYAGAGDSFYRLLHESGLVPVALAAADDSTLPSYGIGLVDLDRAPDGRGWEVPALVDLVARYEPRVLALHGKTAAAAVARSLGIREAPGLGPCRWRVGGAEVFVLPSSSTANRRADYDGRPTRLSWWRELARQVGAAPAEVDENRTRLTEMLGHNGFEDRGAHQDAYTSLRRADIMPQPVGRPDAPG